MLTQQLTITTMNNTIPSFYHTTISGHNTTQNIQILFALLKFKSNLNSYSMQFNHINSLARYIYHQMYLFTIHIISTSQHSPHPRHERSEWMM